jgi:hypothetical protein
MRLDLGVDGPRRSEANLIRPSRGALKRAPHRNFLGCPMDKDYLTLNARLGLFARRAHGMMTISTCSPTAKLSAASSR